ncbi:17_t:CDS:10, partial [Racocetra fulgida]
MPESVTTSNQYGYENQQRTTVPFQTFPTVAQATNSLNQMPQPTTTYSFVSTPLIGQVSQPATGVKPKRQQKGEEKGYQEGSLQASNIVNTTSTPEVVPSTAPVMPPAIPNGGVSMPFNHPIPVNLPLAALQFHSAGAPINVSTPEGLGQFIMIPANNGAMPYYLLVPSSHYPQQSSAANQKQEISITTNQPQQSVTNDQKQVSIPSSGSHLSQDLQSLTQSENNGQGSNLSVLSLVCSEMLDKSHEPSKQKGKKSMENEPPKDKSSPKGSNGNTTPNIEKIHSAVINGNGEQTLETKESSSTPKVKESKITRGENNVNRQESKKGNFVSLTEQSSGVTPMQTDVESQPPTFTIPPACSPLVFSIPANSYPVAPAQVVPIKREMAFSGVSASTDFKRARHSLINDATQGQFQLEVPMTQQYYVPGVQNGPNYLQPPPNQQPRNPIESYEGQGTLFAGARFIDPRLPSPTSFSYVYNPAMGNNHVLQSEVDGKSFATLRNVPPGNGFMGDVRGFSVSCTRSLPNVSVDKELSVKLAEELKYEKGNEPDSSEPSFIKSFLSENPFKIEDKLGANEVALTRTFGNEKIRLLFDINTSEQQAEPISLSGDEEEDDEIDPGKGALGFESIIADGVFLINFVSYYQDAKLAGDWTAEADWKRREHNSADVNGSTISVMEFLSKIKSDEASEEELDPEARSDLIKYYCSLIQKMESVKDDHDQMQSGNQILQTYINNLMSSNVLNPVNGGKKDNLAELGLKNLDPVQLNPDLKAHEYTQNETDESTETESNPMKNTNINDVSSLEDRDVS